MLYLAAGSCDWASAIMSKDFSSLGFAQSYIYPALALFLIPLASLFFYDYVRSDFDSAFAESIIEEINANNEFGPEEKAKMIADVHDSPLSSIMVSNEPNAVAWREDLPAEFVWQQLSIIWAIRLAWFCILGGVGAFVLTSFSVVLSLRSQSMQYYSLLMGWHVLRLFCTLEVIAQGLLVFSLSFWVPAYFFEVFFVKVLLIFGIMAIGAAGVVIAAIFKRVDDEFIIEGEQITREMAPQLWYDLERLANSMGTAPPDHVIAGIDDNFFVTQQPVKVRMNEEQLQTLTGRTLFVSLSLLKKLPGEEADAVLLHELAHFSGNDTLYTQKIAPLLVRYGHFLQGLHDGGISLPVFYFAVMFRALYEISLGSLSRQREFRADGLAADKTSPTSVARALLRTTAYSKYRNELEQEFFDAEQAHEEVNLSQRIDSGFEEFATAFADKHDLGELATAHPFDTHPPLSQRLEALGFNSSPDSLRAAMNDHSMGPWFAKIDGADSLERQQWQQYEEQFRQFHENVLAYRYLPSNPSEQELVEKYFPVVETTAKDRKVIFDFEKITFEDWDQPTYYREIDSMSLENQWGTRLDLVVNRDGKKKTVKIPLSGKQPEQQQVIATLEHYYSRAASAIAYQQSLNPTPVASSDNDTFSME